jgi:hypothetical protein
MKTKIFLVALAVFFTASYIAMATWVEPDPWTKPSDGNVSAPLNVGSVTQAKSGALGVNGVFQTSSSTHLATSGGNVGIGTTSPRTRLELGNDGAILAVGTYNSGWTEPNLGGGTRMLWYPRKSAFRAGTAVGMEWNNANIGTYSIAMGSGTTASNWYSTAMGINTTASGITSTAMGSHTTASGETSTAMGQWVTAGIANNTIVLGRGVSDTNRLVNNTASSLMVGFDSNIPTLFVGPSSGAGTTGRVGIGTASPSSLYMLHVNGDVGAPGFYYSSDRSLKKDITPLKDSLSKIVKMNGVSFKWKETGKESIGLIAQDLEQVLPEAVIGEEGSKSINYSALVASLIEAVKEQQEEIEWLKKELSQLKEN